MQYASLPYLPFSNLEIHRFIYKGDESGGAGLAPRMFLLQVVQSQVFTKTTIQYQQFVDKKLAMKNLVKVNGK